MFAGGLTEEAKQKRKAATADFARRLEKKLLAEEEREKKNKENASKENKAPKPTPIVSKNDPVELEKLRKARKMKKQQDEKERIENDERTRREHDKVAWEEHLRHTAEYEIQQKFQENFGAIFQQTAKDLSERLDAVLKPKEAREKKEDEERRAKKAQLRKQNIPPNETPEAKKTREKKEAEEDAAEEKALKIRRQKETDELTETVRLQLKQENLDLRGRLEALNWDD